MMMICQMTFKMRNQDRYAASGWSQVAQEGGGQVAGQVEGGVNSLHHTAFPHGNSRLSIC